MPNFYKDIISSFDFLLIDGYNIIYDWEELLKLTKISLETARDKLVSILQNYEGYKNISIILVFDAHKTHFGQEKIIKNENITIVYTSEHETADSYIERYSASLSNIAAPYRVAVATSDYAEQVIVMGKGAFRLSAQDLLKEIVRTEKEIKAKLKQNRPIKNNQLLDNLDPKMAELFEKMRHRKT